jgi:hypothetical protein
VADFHFRRTERARFEFATFKTLDRREARLLDRRGQPLAVNIKLSEQPDARSGTRMLAADVVLAPLADGDYVLEIEGGAGTDVERRLVAFRVSR